MKIKGFTLVELVILIVVMGIVTLAILVPLTTTNQNSSTDLYTTTAALLAQERMELIYQQERTVGFANFVDPCTQGSPPPDCTMTGYTISSTIAGTTVNSDINYKLITVTVTGHGYATLTYLVGA